VVAALLLLLGIPWNAVAAPVVRPAVVPGWPVLGPSGGDVFVAPNGTVLSSVPLEAANDHGLSEGVSAHGTPLWRVPYRPVCGNCDGPAVPTLSTTGVLGPIGWFGDGLWALDLAGRDVPPCAGAIGPDGSCYAVTRNLDPGGPASVTRVGVWSFTDAAMPRLLEDTIEQPTLAFGPTAVYVQIPDDVGSQLIALDRASGALLWRQAFPVRVLGPQRLADGTLVLSMPTAGATATSVIGLAPSGAEAWHASVPGSAYALVADPAGATAYLGVGRSVVAVTHGAARTLLRSSHQPRRLALGPQRTLLVGTLAGGSLAPLAEISGFDRTGRLRWRFEQPVEYGDDIGTPAVADDGTVLVSVGDLLFRIDPSRSGPAPTAGARLVVRSPRMRSDGAEQLCPTGRPASCSPATPRGTVVELRLPRGTPRVTVTMSLHARSDPLTDVWSARILAGAGSQWVAVRQPSEDCPDCGSGPVATTPGPYVLSAAWKVGGHLHRLRAAVTIVE